MKSKLKEKVFEIARTCKNDKCYLCNKKADQILSLLKSEILKGMPKKMTNKEAKDEWMTSDFVSPYEEFASFYNNALKEARDYIKRL